MRDFAEQTLCPDTMSKPPARGSALRGHHDLMDVLYGYHQFSRFLTVVETAGFETDFREAGSYTVFAPTNLAFGHSDILSRVCATTQTARDFVDTYVISERRSADLFLDRRTWARNLRGARMMIDGKKTLTFQNAPVVSVDIAARNGVIHALGDLVRETPRHPVPLADDSTPGRQAPELQAA